MPDDFRPIQIHVQPRQHDVGNSKSMCILYVYRYNALIAISMTESKANTYTHWYQIHFLSNLVPFISVYFFELWTWHNIQNDWHSNSNPLSSVSTHSVVCVNSKRSAYLECIFRFFSILTFTFDSVYTYLPEECRRAIANQW